MLLACDNLFTVEGFTTAVLRFSGDFDSFRNLKQWIAYVLSIIVFQHSKCFSLALTGALYTGSGLQ